MRKRFVLLLVVACAGLDYAWAQKPATPAPAAPPEEVIRINVNLVQIDATVTDEQGHPVDHLKAEDFEIRQDGKLQAITNFSYINTKPGQTGVRATPAPAGKKSAGGATAPPPVPLRNDQIRRTFALVVDDLGLAAESIPQVRKALAKFVDEEMQPGDLAAIIGTGRGMGALQQFTTDKRVLHLAIDRIRYNAAGRVGISSFEPSGSLSHLPAAAAQERRSQLNAGSMSAITYVVDGLRELPGRKTMILFTEDLRLMAGNEVDPRAESGLNQIADAASRASVVISSIDPRGLQTLSLTAADSPANAREAGQIVRDRHTQMFFSQDGMVRLAQVTGGEFLHDRNDFNTELHEIVEHASGYYIIAYHPAASTFDQKTGRPLFHRVSIRVKRPGLTVHSRSGFIGNADAPQRVSERTPQAELVHAMNSPFAASAIHVRMTALFSNTTKQGSFVKALLHIDAKDLRWDDSTEGMHKAVLDILSATFDEAGKVQDPVEKIYTVTLPDREYQMAAQNGLQYSFEHPVKKPVAYQMRIALRDSATLQIGTASQFIEVPDVGKGRLALSSIVLQETPTPGQAATQSPLGNSTLRSFAAGSQVAYGLQVINARTDANHKPQLEMEARIFRDGQQINTSKPRPAEVKVEDAAHFISGGVLQLSRQMKPGDYVLQVLVSDKLGDESRVASQWMDFEVRADGTAKP